MKRLAAAALALAATAALAQSPPKKKVAVLRFDDAPVQQAVAAMAGSNQDVGGGIAELLIQKLVEEGKYSVVDRSVLEKVGAEQNLSSGQLTDPDAAAKIGRLVGVDIIIIGSVSQFGAESKQATVNTGSNLTVKGFGIGAVQAGKSTAMVQITARVVDVFTEEIVAAAAAKGEASKAGGLTLAGAMGSKTSGTSINLTGSDFASSLLGEATHKAVNDVAKQLDDKAASLPVHAMKLNALVADVSGSTLIINAGSKSGVKVGDVLTISRFVRAVKDPSTGAVIKTVTETIGTAKVTEADENSATLKLTATKKAKVGDMARSAD
jgi:curli biogenesis system outer membrane secretion channel CsgG